MEEHSQIRHKQEQTNPRPSLWFPQVFMNIDYILEPIVDNKATAYFRDLDFHFYAKLLYHFKIISFTPALCIFRLY